jgi:hypothetical protein
MTCVLRSAAVVRGKVIDKQSGSGVAGVQVHLSQRDDPATRYLSRGGTTDAQGAFTINMKPGKATMTLYGFPKRYVSPISSRRPQEIEITGDMTLPPVELEAPKPLEGTVVDESGKPVAGAEVRYTDTESYDTLHEVVHSDAAGKFSLEKVSAKQMTVVRARTEKAVAEPLNLVPAEAKVPLRLVVSEKTAFAVHGLVVDDAGRPVQDAQVGLMTHWRFGAGGVGFQIFSKKTDADGRINIGGLWPGDGYSVRVEAEGCEKGSSREVQGESGTVHDFGKIVVARVGGAVEGIVVDSAGKPLAGVRLFNSGDGPEPVSGRTDDAGRFRLAGFRSGPVWVLAEIEGFRLTGVRSESRATGVTIKMFRTDEPEPPQPPRAAPISDGQKKQLARKLLERLWASGEGGRIGSVACMTRIDLEQAKKWSSETGGKYETSLRWRLIERTAETDLEEALSMISSKGANPFYLVKRMADRFADSDPAKALRCAEEATVRARSLDQPARATALADIGTLVARLGNKEAGRKLIEEAADMAASMGRAESADRVRARIVAALAPYDLPRALSLLDQVADKRERDRQRCDVAAALDDFSQAETLLKDADPYYAERARTRLAYRLAAKAPLGAVRFIENMPASPYDRSEDNKARALGWAAVAVAPHDRALAHSLIDRAFAIYMAPADDRYMGARGGRPTQAALLAIHAAEIGYPDMKAVVYRVLALRPTSKNAYNPAETVEATAVMAMLLAFVDPETAKQLLQSIETHSDVIGSGYSGVGRGEWLTAWALADPRRAMELAESDLASAKDQRDRQRAQSAAMEVVLMWLDPPRERLKSLCRRLGLDFPDEEL